MILNRSPRSCEKKIGTGDLRKRRRRNVTCDISIRSSFLKALRFSVKFLPKIENCRYILAKTVFYPVFILRMPIIIIIIIITTICTMGQSARRDFRTADNSQSVNSPCRTSSSSVICQTTGPQPLPKRFLHLMRSRASSFN
jgi:hypothetical protein